MSSVYDLLAILSQKGATFCSFVYTNANNETAVHRLILGFDLHQLYARDMEILLPMKDRLNEALVNTILEGQGKVAQAQAELNIRACENVIASRLASLAGDNPLYTNRDTYVHFPNLKGVKMHKATGDIHVHGLSQGKRILTPGVYKTVKSAALTLAQNAIKADLPSSKFRQFKLPNLQEAQIRGQRLKFR